jgi:hypothetical protein
MRQIYRVLQAEQVVRLLVDVGRVGSVSRCIELEGMQHGLRDKNVDKRQGLYSSLHGDSWKQAIELIERRAWWSAA